MCWFECGTTDWFDVNELAPLNEGLGLLPGSYCPHCDGEEQRLSLYHLLISEGFPAGYAIDNHTVMHFVGTEVSDVVSSRRAAAFRVELSDEQALETPLESRRIE